jgi:hypothetical protein
VGPANTTARATSAVSSSSVRTVFARRRNTRSFSISYRCFFHVVISDESLQEFRCAKANRRNSIAKGIVTKLQNELVQGDRRRFMQKDRATDEWFVANEKDALSKTKGELNETISPHRASENFESYF